MCSIGILYLRGAYQWQKLIWSAMESPTAIMQKMQFEWSNWVSEIVFSVHYVHSYMHQSAAAFPSTVISGFMIIELFPGIGHDVCLKPVLHRLAPKNTSR